MQSLRLRSVVSLATLHKNLIRTVAVNSAALNVSEEDTQQLKSWKEIPGPSSLPIIGQLLHFMPGGMFYNVKGFELSEKLLKEYGPIIKFDGMFGRPTMILVIDAESAAQVLRGENWMPARPGFQSLEYFRKYYNKTKEQSLQSTGLLTEHGDNWKQFRSTVNPVLLQPKTIKLYSTILDKVAMDMIARMRSIRDENNKLQGNFDVEMNLWALESIGVVALGTRLNCFDPNLAEDSYERKLIQCVHDLFKAAEQLDFQPSLWRYISTPAFKKAMKLYEEQTNIAKYFIKRATQELKTKSKTDDEKGVLEKLLEIDEDVATIMASDMLLAGVDTAANTMSATFYLLAVNPDKQNKLREEIKQQQEKRPYLKACIKESMRMMPVVGGNIRQINKDYNILGYRIPKDMYVSFGHQSLSMMQNHYPRPQEYIPERWIADKGHTLYHGNAHPFAFSPFGFGVRSCVGRRIAELEMETFLAKIIENFQIEWSGPPPTVTATSINYVTGPFNFIFKDV